MSTLGHNNEAQQLLAQARGLRAAFISQLVVAAARWIGRILIRIDQGLTDRATYRALSQLDRHTLVDVGLDHMVPDYVVRGNPANENRPRYVA